MDELNENDVVISGLSGSFPKAENVDEFTQKLFAKENLLQNEPHIPSKVGKMKNLDKFDAEFFDFHQPHRVNLMDPMARIILEKTHEALIDSGTNPASLRGSNCGVFIGIHFLETEVLMYEKIQKGAVLASAARSFNANRISYWLGIHGPSFIVDSACSSTLLALEQGFKAIRSGECESALVGGCNVCLHPAPFLHLLKVGALNPKSEANVFDEKAGGFCRAETVGMFYIQKAKNAKRIYAQIVNVRSNHDGKKPLFLAPYAPSQIKLLTMIYDEAQIEPNHVSWIESHATGTLVGDKQEVMALDEIFGRRETPLLIGSVKSNMGHAEAAAGVASLAKVIIAMETGFIPPNINLTSLRKDLEGFAKGRIKVVIEKTPWTGGFVGINGFGMGGANTHVILKSFNKEKINHSIPDDFLPRIVGVSGRTEEAVEMFLHYLEMTSLDVELIGLLHQIHNYNVPNHPYRGFAILHKNENCTIKMIKQIDRVARPVMFVYTSYLNDWSNIYRSLTDVQVFQTTIDKCAHILSQFELNLHDILDNSTAVNCLFDGLIAAVTLQVALTDLMRSLKIIPDFIVGFFIGELVCAYADQCLTIDETLVAAYHCAAYLSKQMENTSKSVTVVIDKQFTDLRSLIPHNLTFVFPSIVSGPQDDVALFLTMNRLTSINVLNGDLHAPALTDADKLRTLLEQTVCPKAKSNKWISSFKKSTTNQSVITCEYFVNCLSSCVNVDNFPFHVIAVQFLATKYFDISRHLIGESIRISLAEETSTVNITDVLSALGELYLCGSNPNFDTLYPPVMFPVSRGTKMLSPLVKWKHSATWPVAFSSFQERMLSGERKVSVALEEKEHSYLAGHEIDSTVIYPGAAYLILAWETLALAHGHVYTDIPVVFEHVRFHKAVPLSRSEPVVFNVMVMKGNGYFEIMENSVIVASGRVYLPSNVKTEMTQLTTPIEDVDLILDQIPFYRHILVKGYNFKGAFRSILKINSEEIEAWKDKRMNIVQSGGVQFKGCTFRPLPPKLSNKVPLVQKYLFTPYISLDQKLTTNQTICMFMHTIADFFGQNNSITKIAEIVDEETSHSSALLASLFSKFCKEQPVFQAEIKVYHSSRDFTKSNNGVLNVFGKLPLSEQVHVISCSDIFDYNKLKKIWNSLHDNGFLISRQSPYQEIIVPNEWNICCNVLTRYDRLLLFRKRAETRLNSVKIIRVSSSTFEWIVELQEALKAKDAYHRIIIYAEREIFNGILGFYNCLRLEWDTDHVRCFFIMDDIPENFSLENEFFKTQASKDLAVNVFRNGSWGCYVRQHLSSPQPVKVVHSFLNNKNHKTKQTLNWFQGPIKSTTLVANEAKLIYVYYCAINPIDISIYKNRLARETILKNSLRKDCVFGIEFSGRTAAGVRCMGLLSNGCMSTLIERSDEDIFFNEVPCNWSLEDAVTVPMAYYIAIYSLVMCCKLGTNEKRPSILIHSAGSVIGQAAINVAAHYGCSLFVIVDSIEEKIFIKDNFPFIPESSIGSSTDGTLFEYAIIQNTGHKGVEVVLNTQSENKMDATVNCLAWGGQLVQLKRIDLRNTNLNANKLLTKNISLHSALLEDIFNMEREMKSKLKQLVDDHIKTSAVKPLPRTVFSYAGIESAFEYASSARTISKCVVQIEPEEENVKSVPYSKPKEAWPRFACSAAHSYVVCGGLGGMGIELVNWLVHRGAKNIVVASLRGVRNDGQRLRLSIWKAYGVRVKVLTVDVAKKEGTVKILEEANRIGDVAGIFNLAGVLKDAVFKKQTAESFNICAGPKLHGTFNLDQLSRMQCPNLEQFVIFSTIACGYGNLGQTNYGMFNSTVERICEQRRENNLPALAIEWGPVGNVGMVVSLLDGNTNESFGGCYMQPIKSCWEVLDLCLCQKDPIIVSIMLADKQRDNH